MKKRILWVSLLVPVLLISGCSSRSATHAGCDFVVGASGNAQKREAYESRSGSMSSRHDTRDSTRDDVTIGIFSAVFGAFSRMLNDDDKGCI